MTGHDRRNLAWALTAVAAVIFSLGFAVYVVDHQTLHRHLVHLPTPAPTDHGWTTPSQPGATP